MTKGDREPGAGRGPADGGDVGGGARRAGGGGLSAFAHLTGVAISRGDSAGRRDRSGMPRSMLKEGIIRSGRPSPCGRTNPTLSLCRSSGWPRLSGLGNRKHPEVAMITNERQYRIAKAQLERLRSELEAQRQFSLLAGQVDPSVIQVERNGAEESIREIASQVELYEDAKSGQRNSFLTNNINELGVLLICARVAAGMSQRELAERMGLKEQQVQRYEQENYRTANLNRLSEVVEALGATFEGIVTKASRADIAQTRLSITQNQQFDVAKLPIREMIKRGWIGAGNLSPERSIGAEEIESARDFMMQALAGNHGRALHYQNVRVGSVVDRYALLAWKARVLDKASKMNLPSFSPSAIDTDFIRDLVQSSSFDDGPRRAAAALGQIGVALVFEKHLPGTHLDGAAMLLNREAPVIGMTIRFDRLDNFWFVLMHELGHIALHRNKGLDDGFYDEGESETNEPIEDEADTFAKGALIPENVWKSSFVRFTKSSEQIRIFASRHGVSPAIVAGRIRRERLNDEGRYGNYKIFSDLVGQGEVSRILKNAGLMEG